MSPAVEAGFWGFVSGGALVLGAAVGYLVRLPGRVTASVIAFGSGVAIAVGALLDGDDLEKKIRELEGR